jgi:hypothetical protein
MGEKELEGRATCLVNRLDKRLHTAVPFLKSLALMLHDWVLSRTLKKLLSGQSTCSRGRSRKGKNGPADGVSSQRLDAKSVFIARSILLSLWKPIFLLARVFVVEGSALLMASIKLGVSTPFRVLSANTRAASTIGQFHLPTFSYLHHHSVVFLD